MRRSFLVAVAMALAVAACGGTDQGLEVSNVRIGQPTGPNAALYFTVVNHTEGPDLLQGASTGVADGVEIHETIVDDDGTMRMQPLDEPLEIAGGASLELEPGGVHLMLVDVDRLEVGDAVVVTLSWQNAGQIDVEAEVVEPQDAVEHEDHG